jgi:hypothetical protein
MKRACHPEHNLFCHPEHNLFCHPEPSEASPERSEGAAVEFQARNPASSEMNA